MAATIRLTRPKTISPGCARPLAVLVDGKAGQPIESGQTNEYSVQPGPHRLQVKQDFSRSTELKLSVQEGSVTALECGSYVEGWQFYFGVLWCWRVFAPGKLFYIKRKAGAV